MNRLSGRLFSILFFLFFLVGCGSNTTDSVFTNNTSVDPAQVVVNTRVSGGYFLVGTSVNPDPDDPGRETNFSASVQFNGQGGIVPGGISIVQEQSVVDGVHAGGNYTIDGLGGITATLTSIFGPIELMGGQTQGDAGRTSSFATGTFSMDSGQTNGRIPRGVQLPGNQQ